MNTWNAWKLCSRASGVMDSELKEQNAGSSKTQWNTWAVLSAKKEFRQQRGNPKGKNSHQPNRVKIIPGNG